ncbi:DUF2599 domain-containing protein [Cellulosimicrobium sp. Marseille-Q8652]
MSRSPGRARRAVLALAAALALGATGACTADDPAAPARTTQAGTAAPGAEEPSPQEPPTSTVDTARVTSDDVAVDFEVPRSAEAAPDDGGPGPVEVGADADGATTLTVEVGTEPVVLVLATPGTFAANADGTVTVLAADGTPVGGLTRPDGPGTAARARFAVVGPTRVELTVDAAEAAASGTPGGTVTTTLGTAALRTAVWGEREGGRSLAVDPTGWGRTGGTAAQDVLWTALVAAEPEADTPGMHDQLVCHALGAPDKATWNLEPWRPDVGLVAVLAARCNPT